MEDKKSRCRNCSYCSSPSCVGESTARSKVMATWKASGKKVSLKKFARGLLKENDSAVEEWFLNKSQ
jgi:hypothetical protein